MTLESTARSRSFGREVAMLRENTGHSMVGLAEQIGTHPPTLSRFEAGTRRLSEVKLVQYLTLCGMKFEEIIRMVDLAKAPETGYHVADSDNGTIDDLIALVVHETTAKTIEQYENTVVPGLLQSRDYALSLFRNGGMVAEDKLARAVERRFDRQSVLRGTNPPGAAFYIAEHALRNVVGGPPVMHDQMMRLIFASDYCSIRVVPSAKYGETGAPGTFRFMTFAEHGPVVSLDMLAAMVFTEKPRDYG